VLSAHCPLAPPQGGPGPAAGGHGWPKTAGVIVIDERTLSGFSRGQGFDSTSQPATAR